MRYVAFYHDEFANFIVRPHSRHLMKSQQTSALYTCISGTVM